MYLFQSKSTPVFLLTQSIHLFYQGFYCYIYCEIYAGPEDARPRTIESSNLVKYRPTFILSNTVVILEISYWTTDACETQQICEAVVMRCTCTQCGPGIRPWYGIEELISVTSYNLVCFITLFVRMSVYISIWCICTFSAGSFIG